jgi:hypothetical protein
VFNLSATRNFLNIFRKQSNFNVNAQENPNKNTFSDAAERDDRFLIWIEVELQQ